MVGIDGNPRLGGEFDRPQLVADMHATGYVLAPGAGLRPQIHDTAIIGGTAEWIGRVTRNELVEIGFNTVIRAYVTVDRGVERQTRIGRDCLLCAHVYVGHDVQIGDRAQIAPSAVIGGCVTIGDDVKIGLNATIMPWRTIGDGARIGASAVVTHDVPAGEVWIGNPARKLR